MILSVLEMYTDKFFFESLLTTYEASRSIFEAVWSGEKIGHQVKNQTSMTKLNLSKSADTRDVKKLFPIIKMKKRIHHHYNYVLKGICQEIQVERTKIVNAQQISSS